VAELGRKSLVDRPEEQPQAPKYENHGECHEADGPADPEAVVSK